MHTSINTFPFAVQHDIVGLQILDLSFQRPQIPQVSWKFRKNRCYKWKFLASCENTHPNCTILRMQPWSRGAFQNLWALSVLRQRIYPFWVDLMTSMPFQTVPCLVDGDFLPSKITFGSQKKVHWKIAILETELPGKAKLCKLYIYMLMGNPLHGSS